jgi:purine-cytosine permease-like protein
MLDRQNWWQLSAVQIGGAICLPVIVIGQTLYQTYGFESSIAAVIVGNAVLLLLSIVAVWISYDKKKTTVDTAADFFDKRGTRLFALAMTFSLVCWFAIQTDMMALGVVDLFGLDGWGSGGKIMINAVLGAIMTLACLYGVKGFRLLANISMPLFLFTLAYAFFTVEPIAPTHAYDFSLGGSSLIIAISVAIVMDFPTYFRFARKKRDGIISIFLIFACALPFLQILGIYLAQGVTEGSILDTLKRSEIPLWNIWIALFLILAGWTTNNLNLYSAAMSIQSIYKNVSEKSLTLLLGLVGTVLSLFDLLAHLEAVLDLMGILVVSMGSVIIFRYAIVQMIGQGNRPCYHPLNIYAWAIGIGFGLLSLTDYSLTAIPLVDAIIGTALGTLFTPLLENVYEKT